MSVAEKDVLLEENLDIPIWLNAEFIQKHLQNYYGNNGLKVRKFSVNLATAKGENFTSSIYRVNVEFINNEQVILVTFKVFFYCNLNGNC